MSRLADIMAREDFEIHSMNRDNPQFIESPAPFVAESPCPNAVPMSSTPTRSKRVQPA